MTAFDRLRTAGDIRAVFAVRNVAQGPAMAVHGRRRLDDGPGRATVVVGRKLGDAVRRNRAKRRLRAALQHSCPPPGLDVVVVGRSSVLTADFGDLVRQAQRLLERVHARAEASTPDASPTGPGAPPGGSAGATGPEL
ncbi:MAG TPA: ribonuclease P protein component [Egibacteraceae bacterium]|nr:ribonuclease P protein component [Egibacteraceae bacterium]